MMKMKMKMSECVKNNRCGILRERRLRLGLTSKDIGKAVGINPVRYMRYEDGKLDIMKGSFDVVCGILFLLGLDVATFYGDNYRANEGIEVVDGKLAYGGNKDKGVKLFVRSEGYDVDAAGLYTFTNRLVVLAGSRISFDSTLAEKGYAAHQELRQKLIEIGIVKDRVFTEDYEFHSPSEALSVICGRHLSGSNVWCTEDGILLRDLIKK